MTASPLRSNRSSEPANATLVDALGRKVGRVTRDTRGAIRIEWLGRPWPMRSFTLQPDGIEPPANVALSDEYAASHPEPASNEPPQATSSYDVSSDDASPLGQLIVGDEHIAWVTQGTGCLLERPWARMHFTPRDPDTTPPSGRTTRLQRNSTVEPPAPTLAALRPSGGPGNVSEAA